jgi:hypothetical protein
LVAVWSSLTSAGCGPSAATQAEPAPEGRLERADYDVIAGWAWDRNLPWPPAKVDIYEGDTLLATVPANRLQDELRDRGIGSGYHWFEFDTPARLKDGKPHKVRVKFSGTGRELEGSPKDLALAAGKEPEGGRELDEQQYQQLVREVRKAVDRTLPRDATVIVVSHGDDNLLKLDGRTGWHFPQDKSGAWGKNEISDSADAIAQVEALRARGGQFLLFPQTEFWWLDENHGYKEFKQYLEKRCQLFYSDRHCKIYRLERPKDR